MTEPMTEPIDQPEPQDEQPQPHHGLPIGSVTPFAGPLNRQTLDALERLGWLPCTGLEVHKENYRRLYRLVGDTFGATGNLETFRLPNLQSRVPVGVGNDHDNLSKRTLGETGGSEAHTLSVDEIPPHHHGIPRASRNVDDNHVNPLGRGATRTPDIKTSQTGGGQPHNNMQPFLALNYIIRAS